ncbi:FKBP-type peptidyl-prolyl cis-trans isomerase [Nocardioides sp. Bht2]|uniref:FKBP-type peptidyl-prolyl cis-trans isomerase n=1 Tax=Nocardioides sp. Bht2 TaxID=3392297 RepID=UPI0039B372C4
MRRLRVVVPLAALLITTVACGNDSDDKKSDAGSGAASLKGLTVSGEFGKAPKVEVDKFDVDKATSDVVIKGDGAKVTETSKINYRFAMVYGSNGDAIQDNFTAEKPDQFDLAQQNETLAKALIGNAVGSRVVLALPVEEMVGEENVAQSGLKAGDDLVMIIDLISESAPPLDGPEGKKQQAPAGTPGVVEKDGAVTGLDFSKSPAKPSGKLEVVTLIEGTGDAIAEGDNITVDYFGAVYGGKKPFDESFSGDPITFSLAPGSLIEGWVKGLDGVKAGSRVLLTIPAEQGYGDKAQSSIPANSTLVFVIDVLGVNL